MGDLRHLSGVDVGDGRRSFGTSMETGLTHLERSDAMGADNETSDPCLFFRDGAGRQQMTILSSAAARRTIGRGPGSDLHLPWDNEVSRLHAQLEHVGSDWILVDDGPV